MLALGTDRLEAAAAYLGRGASRFWGPSFLPFCIHLGQFVILAEFWEKLQKLCVPFRFVHFSELLIVRVLQLSKFSKKLEKSKCNSSGEAIAEKEP